MKPKTLLQSAAMALGAVGFCALSSRPLLGAPARPASLPASRPSADIGRAVDDKEQDDVLLGRRADGVVARTTARMDESARRLAREFDPGRQTQEVQRRILDDIEDLIDALNKDKGARGAPGRPTSLSMRAARTGSRRRGPPTRATRLMLRLDRIDPRPAASRPRQRPATSPTAAKRSCRSPPASGRR
jgi:hypothetical protein